MRTRGAPCVIHELGYGHMRESKASEKRGIEGWLTLPALGATLCFVRAAQSATFVGVVGLLMLLDPNGRDEMPWVPLLTWMGLFVAWGFTIFLLCNWSWAFPRAFIAVSVTNLACYLAFVDISAFA